LTHDLLPFIGFIKSVCHVHEHSSEMTFFAIEERGKECEQAEISHGVDPELLIERLNERELRGQENTKQIYHTVSIVYAKDSADHSKNHSECKRRDHGFRVLLSTELCFDSHD
jgi:hypothetical protein